MDRCHLEMLGQFPPDEETEDQRLIAETGNQHERNVLAGLKVFVPGLLEVRTKDLTAARQQTVSAFASKAPIVF
jgi:hypothetical protein